MYDDARTCKSYDLPSLWDYTAYSPYVLPASCDELKR
jgi:hypothetical protein